MSQKSIWILWPGFLVAIPSVGITFSLFDPADIHFLGNPVEINYLAVYTLGFLFFWMIGAASSAITCLLQHLPNDGSS